MSANDHDIRLEEAAAYALGALDADRVDDFKDHLDGCERCQSEVRWLAPAIEALPEAVERADAAARTAPRLMAEVRADAAAHAKQAKRDERRERAASRAGLTEWLRGLSLGGLTYKPLAGMAAVVLVVAAIAGYAVGTGGGSGSGGTHTTEVAAAERDRRQGGHRRQPGRGPTDRRQAAAGRQSARGLGPARAMRSNRSRRCSPPTTPGNAATTIDNMMNVSAVLVTREPMGGTKVPTTEPIVKVPLA